MSSIRSCEPGPDGAGPSKMIVGGTRSIASQIVAEPIESQSWVIPANGGGSWKGWPRFKNKGPRTQITRGLSPLLDRSTGPDPDRKRRVWKWEMIQRCRVKHLLSNETQGASA